MSFADSKVVYSEIMASLSVFCFIPTAVLEAAWLEVDTSSKNLVDNVKKYNIFSSGYDFEKICHIKLNNGKIGPLNYLI